MCSSDHRTAPYAYLKTCHATFVLRNASKISHGITWWLALAIMYHCFCFGNNRQVFVEKSIHCVFAFRVLFSFANRFRCSSGILDDKLCASYMKIQFVYFWMCTENEQTATRIKMCTQGLFRNNNEMVGTITKYQNENYYYSKGVAMIASTHLKRQWYISVLWQ